jgi:hypothetical protein
VDVAGHDYELLQSPGLLNAIRGGGTTGAVLWKVSPAVARWLVRDTNMLWTTGVLHQKATVVELGCGISGLIGLSLYRKVDTYLLTDQQYVLKRLQENIDANMRTVTKKGPSSKARLCVAPLDWEHDKASNIRTAIGNGQIDLVLACDCIYNDFLTQPFVEMCKDACTLSETKTTVLLVAQQLRSNDVLIQWLVASLEYFDVWRIPDEELSSELISGTGFAVHLLLLKDDQK